MKPTRNALVTILLFGTVWGGLEALISATIDGISAPLPRSVILAAVALFVLSMARHLLPARGSTAAIGMVAMALKAVSLPSLMGCQLAAVLGQAVLCEVAFSLVVREGFLDRLSFMIPLMVATSYVNSLLFAFSQAYLFQNAWWLDRGFWGLLSWSFEIGSMAAAASVVGYVGGRSLAAKLGAGYDAMVNHHRLAYEAISVTVAIGIFAAVTLA